MFCFFVIKTGKHGKSQKLADELEGIIKSLSFFLSEEISKIEEVQELKAKIKQRDQKIELLEQRIGDLELYSVISPQLCQGCSQRPTR